MGPYSIRGLRVLMGPSGPYVAYGAYMWPMYPYGAYGALCGPMGPMGPYGTYEVLCVPMGHMGLIRGLVIQDCTNVAAVRHELSDRLCHLRCGH